MPTTARVARIHEYGPPEVLRFEDIVVGEPGDDEALIRNTVIGLNFVDVYYRRGTLPVPAFPAIVGDEAAGVVEAAGKNVKNVSVVDRVVYGVITITLSEIIAALCQFLNCFRSNRSKLITIVRSRLMAVSILITMIYLNAVHTK